MNAKLIMLLVTLLTGSVLYMSVMQVFNPSTETTADCHYELIEDPTPDSKEAVETAFWSKLFFPLSSEGNEAAEGMASDTVRGLSCATSVMEQLQRKGGI